MRERFSWNVTLQAANGQMKERKVEAFWSPDHELTLESVGVAASTRENYICRDQKLEHHVISIERLDGPKDNVVELVQ